MKITWEYIAGFFDGEGNICVCNGRHPKRVLGSNVFQASITQSGAQGKLLLQAIGDVLAKHGIRSCICSNRIRSERHAKTWRLSVGGRMAVYNFLLKIYPYLWIKRVKAMDTMRFIRMFPNAQGKLSGEGAMKVLRMHIDTARVLDELSRKIQWKDIAHNHGISETTLRRIRSGTHWSQRKVSCSR